MIPEDAGEPAMRDLSELRVLMPDPDRTARTRARCRARLERCQERAPHVNEAPAAGFVRRVLVPAGVLMMCFFYVVSLVRIALQLRASF